MSKQTADDLGAVRAVVDALQPFAREEQERIIRWAREKLGLVIAPPTGADSPSPPSATPRTSPPTGGGLDLRGFVAQKNPQSDTHFAATVAYFYRFEVPEGQRKDVITATDLQDACRLADRHRLKRPLLTLNNAHRDGLLDRGPERGTFVINSVGENLVAMALPAGPGAPTKRRPASKKRRQTRKKK